MRKQRNPTHGQGGTPLPDLVLRLLTDRLNLQVASPETDLLEAGLLDSLTFVQLLVHIEHEFGVTVSPGDLDIENFRSVSEIARLVATCKYRSPWDGRGRASRAMCRGSQS